jgi:hypothetical protein
VPLPLDEAAHARNPLLSDLGREHRTKPVPPKSDGLMTDVDPRSAKRSSTFRNESGYRTYIITTKSLLVSC